MYPRPACTFFCLSAPESKRSRLSILSMAWFDDRDTFGPISLHQLGLKVSTEDTYEVQQQSFKHCKLLVTFDNRRRVDG